MLTIQAPAKINLVLEVLGKRADGYHDIKSLMQTVDLCDTLTFEETETIALQCSDPSLQEENNLIIKAAELMKKTTGYKGGARINLEKKIPVSAGLGGGSSDAAVTLTGLNKLWNCGLNKEELVKIAAKLGSDVPFFIYGGLALVEGRGEKLTPLKGKLHQTFIILCPELAEIEGKTTRLYSLLLPEHYSKGNFTDKAIESLSSTGDIQSAFLYNTFDLVAEQAFPGLDIFKNALAEVGAAHIHLTGSGPSLFTMVENENRSKEIYKKLKEQGYKSFLVLV